MRSKREEQEERRRRAENQRNRRKSYQSYELRDQSPRESYSETRMSPARARVERKKREREAEELSRKSRSSRSSRNDRTMREQNVPANRKSNIRHSEEIGRNNRDYGKNRMGNLLANIQILVTLAFIAILFFVNVIPYVFAGIISAVALLLAVIIKMNQKRKNKRHGLSKLLSIIITILLLFISFYLVRGYLILADMGGENNSTLNLDQDTYSVYISGIDVYGEVTEQSRSDVNLIATVNPKTHQVLLTTTPRDYYVVIPGVSNGERDKLTHAGIYGIDKSMATLDHLYDEKIDFYIRVNFSSVIDIVDALGGVTVDSVESFKTGKAAGCVVDIKKGENKLNGKQALAFARERHALEDGDNQRGKNQQILLKGIYKSMMKPTILTNMNGVLSSIDGNVETNMTTSQLQSFSKGVLGGGANMNIYSIAAEGTSARRYCYSYPGKSLYVCVPNSDSVDKITDLMNGVGQGNILPKEEK